MSKFVKVIVALVVARVAYGALRTTLRALESHDDVGDASDDTTDDDTTDDVDDVDVVRYTSHGYVPELATDRDFQVR